MKVSLILALTQPLVVTAFVLPKTINVGPQRPSIHRLGVAPSDETHVEACGVLQRSQRDLSTTMNLAGFAASVGLGTALLFTSPSLGQTAAWAYDPSDYAGETVQSTITGLKDSAGNAEETYKVFEEINSIITEGKGVGGALNYKGVQLERGYVADEDTTIYNPGLSLLTESEKERLMEAVVANRKLALEKGDWPQSNQLAFEFLRVKLDPFHVAELRGYLRILPFYAAAIYLGVLAVQQFLRDLFPAAYIVGVIAVFAPAILLVAVGP